jgi:tetratricopeptide (TPR) repeat protein/TolB-like protein
MIGPLLLAAVFTALPPVSVAHAAVTVGTRPAAQQPPPDKILIVPFDTAGRDPRTYWLGEGVAMLVAESMSARGLGAISRSARERAYEQLHLPPHTTLSRATVLKVGQLAGATQVIVGDVQVEANALTIRARAIHMDVGRAAPDVVERGSLEELFSVADRVTQRLIPGGATAAPRPSPSLQVFEQYIKGLLAERPASQAEFLEAALRKDPSYDLVRLALWDVRNAQGDHAAALEAVKAIPASTANGRRARFLAALSLTSLRRYDEAFATLKALQDEAPDPAILNNLGVVQLRRMAPPDTGKPAYFLTKAVEAEPDDPDFLFNLGYAYAVDRDPQAALYWLNEAVRRNTADGDAHFVLAAELEAAGKTVEAGRERELAGQLVSKYADRRLEPLPRGLERIRQDLDSRRDQTIDRALASTAQRNQQDLAQFHLDRGHRLFDQEQDREAMAELRRAVFLSPYDAQAHLLIGRIHLRAGRPREAVDALKISIWSRDTAPAHVALAEAYLRLKDVSAARLQVQRALALDPASAEARQLQARIEKGG